MGFLDRAIKNGISKGIGEAVGKAVEKAVTPKATEWANKTAEQFDRATGSMAESAQEVSKSTSGLEGAFANLQRAAEGYATEMSKNVKVCPSCGEPTTAEKAFCPLCGAKLPELSVAEGAVCSSCGKQNTVGTKFCAFCGAKLPAAVAEEAAQKEKDSAVLAKWDELLPWYPKWAFGGCNYEINENGDDGRGNINYLFEADGVNLSQLNQYVELLKQNGFIPAFSGSSSTYYKVIDGVCRAFDRTEALAYERMTIGFYVGDYDKKKEEPAKKSGGLLGGLFGL